MPNRNSYSFRMTILCNKTQAPWKSADDKMMVQSSFRSCQQGGCTLLIVIAYIFCDCFSNSWGLLLISSEWIKKVFLQTSLFMLANNVSADFMLCNLADLSADPATFVSPVIMLWEPSRETLFTSILLNSRWNT